MVKNTKCLVEWEEPMVDFVVCAFFLFPLNSEQKEQLILTSGSIDMMAQLLETSNKMVRH